MIAKLTRIFSVVINLVLLLIIALLVLSKVSGQSTIQAFNVLTGSMSPQINQGSLVITRKVSDEKMQVGDVITYNVNDELVTHRIVQIQNENQTRSYITQGDRNQTADYLAVKPKQIEGRLMIVIPHMGRIGTIIQTERGQLALCLTVLQLWLLMSLFKQLIASYNSQEQERREGEKII
jgi:signal peptidase I, archaeal type